MDDQQSFKNLLKVTDYLVGLGYKIKRATVYKHAAAGLLKRQDDGTVKLSDVATYALVLRLRSDEQAIPDAAIKSAREDLVRIMRTGAVIVQALDELLGSRQAGRGIDAVHVCQCRKGATASAEGPAIESVMEQHACGCDKSEVINGMVPSVF